MLLFFLIYGGAEEVDASEGATRARRVQPLCYFCGRAQCPERRESIDVVSHQIQSDGVETLSDATW